jgi:hypothetical protein
MYYNRDTSNYMHAKYQKKTSFDKEMSRVYVEPQEKYVLNMMAFEKSAHPAGLIPRPSHNPLTLLVFGRHALC